MIINTPTKSNIVYDRSDNSASVGTDNMWRMPSTGYSVGDVRYAPGYNGLLLTCKTAGTTDSGDLPTITAEMTEVTDGLSGPVVWRITRLNNTSAIVTSEHRLIIS